MIVDDGNQIGKGGGEEFAKRSNEGWGQKPIQRTYRGKKQILLIILQNQCSNFCSTQRAKKIEE